MKELSILLCFISSLSFAQLPNKPTLADVRSYNQGNMLKVEIGNTKNQVLEEMGGVQIIQTWSPRNPNTWAKPKSITISNPYSRDLKLSKDSTTVEVLWYYTDIKNYDNAINKEELTPIIIAKNSVIGLGWGFYTDYAKKQEIMIDMR